MKNQLLLFILLLIPIVGNTQAILRGTVMDENGEPIIGAMVALYQNGVLKTGSQADIDGLYRISDLKSGLYDIECSMIGAPKVCLKNVNIKSQKVNTYDFILDLKPLLLNICEIKDYKIPIVIVDALRIGCSLAETHLLLNGQSTNGRNQLRFMLDNDIYSRPDFYVIEKSEDQKNWSFLAKTYPLYDKIGFYEERNASMKTPIGFAPSQYIDDVSLSKSDTVYYRVYGFQNPDSDLFDFQTELFYDIPIRRNNYVFGFLKMPKPQTSIFRIQYAKTDAHDPNLHISIKSSANAPAKLIITDMLGRIWVNQQILLMSGEVVLQQPIEQLIAGTYTVSIVEGASIETKKFVKM